MLSEAGEVNSDVDVLNSRKYKYSRRSNGAQKTSNKEQWKRNEIYHLSLKIFFLLISIGFLATDTAFSTTARSGNLILVSWAECAFIASRNASCHNGER